MKKTDNLKVLLVDDDPAMCRLVAKWMSGAGYDVACAADAREAIEQIRESCPQIVITDWDMPEMNGIDLCKWLRCQDLPHYVYTVLLTVRAGTDDIVHALEAGADTFLKKPVDRPELLARMQCGIRVLQLENRLKEVANSDALTGLATQRTLYDRMKSEWSRAERHFFSLSTVMLDIDYFKRINDTYGHAVGDKVICAIAKILADNCRTSDVVSRYGGEEFCVFLPETDEHHATLWADRIREKIAQLEFPMGDQKFKITASFGVAERMVDTPSPEELVDRADQALLIAKRSGRDRVINFRSLADGTANLGDDHGVPCQLLANVVAQQVMTTVVMGLDENDPVGRATRYFLRFRVNSAPVVGSDGKLVGVLSEKDVLAIMLCPNWWEKKVSDVMKRNVVCYDESTPAIAIHEFLCRVSMRAVVIIRDERPVGMISRGSILRWFTNALIVGAGKHSSISRSLGMEIQTDSSGKLSNDTMTMTKLSRAASELAREAGDLNQRIQGPDVEVVPCVVSGASRLQELIDDLLAASSPIAPDNFPIDGMLDLPQLTDDQE